MYTDWSMVYVTMAVRIETSKGAGPDGVKVVATGGRN